MTPAADEQRDTRRPGYRLGPFIIVPELRTSANDPWAHRKGEPRMLALIWAMYLMGGALTTIFAVRSLGAPATNRYEYGCRAMILIIGVGTCVLWPMTRLSQAPPREPLRATLIDLFAILAPVQAVIWPMPLLTDWRWDLAAGLSLMIACWTALAGVLVARGTGSRSMATRTLLTIIAVLVVGAAPALSLITGAAGAPPLPAWWSMLSPITATIALTDSPGNQIPAMSLLDWTLSAAPLVVALALLTLPPHEHTPLDAPGTAQDAEQPAEPWSTPPAP